MSVHLDELYRQYCTLLRDGLAPAGLVLEYELLQRIAQVARRDDPRVGWGAGGLERLFGFKPQFVLQAPARFTLPHGEVARREAGPDFTLRELRAL